MREGVPWTDGELRVAVETYRFLLRLEHGGHVCSENEVAGLLRGGLLAGRNQASLRYRLRNISAILADRDRPTLRAYSPAPRAGAGVRARLEAMLFNETPGHFLPDGPPGDSQNELTPEQVLARAETALRVALEKFERQDIQSAPIGHNQPPEPIDGLTADDFREAIAVLKASREELAANRLSTETAAARAGLLTRFGIRAAGWAGERFTKATDAGLEAGARLAARLCVLAVFAALPPVAKAIETLVQIAAG